MEDRKSFKVMITGDSMTQGSEGDYTWRYRLWQWLNSTSGPKIEFVGPYKGTQAQCGPRRPQPPGFLDEPDAAEEDCKGGKYAEDVESAWYSHSNHFSSWGYRAADCKDAILEQINTYQPDYLLVPLGFNDMGWLFSDAKDLLREVKDLVANARQGKSNIRIILSTVPHRTFMDGREDLVDNTNYYNKHIQPLIDSLTSPTSPIHLADFAKHYDCTIATYDGLHPNALGEYQIALSFSEALQAFSLRPSTCPLIIPCPVPEPPLPAISHLTAAGFPMGVRLTWSSSFGARSYDVRSRQASSDRWDETGALGPRFDTTATMPGVQWEYSVRASRGDGDKYKTAWSEVVSATAHNNTAPPPSDAIVTPEEGGVKVAWEAVQGWDVERYEVMLWDMDTPGAFFEGYGARGTAVEMKHLKQGHRYQTWLKTWAVIEGEVAGGAPGGARPFRTGAGRPEPPGGLRYEVKDPVTVKLDWEPVEDAAAYLVYKRNIVDRLAEFETDGNCIHETTHEMSVLFPGVWGHEFYVVAVNGDLGSKPSNKVRPSPFAEGAGAAEATHELERLKIIGS
ncbi:SGNH hydrolase [Myriangium duriaei CBS 260.36]|uniref:SGNH hydrolase n=1 Tax=Myriangium duriaei CBS 260.36 TaxID=1168546 RepID=A0A9P4MFS7_9PEZI|nr:SGNH hydrolase [Myriangium duriaei CBS 260.36]